MVQALDRSNCGIARSRGKEASVKADEPTTTMTGRSLAWMPNGGAGREPAWQRKSAAQSSGLPGTAGRGPACPVVGGPGGQSSRLPDFGIPLEFGIWSFHSYSSSINGAVLNSQ